MEANIRIVIKTEFLSIHSVSLANFQMFCLVMFYHLVGALDSKYPIYFHVNLYSDFSFLDDVDFLLSFLPIYRLFKDTGSNQDEIYQRLVRLCVTNVAQITTNYFYSKENSEA